MVLTRSTRPISFQNVCTTAILRQKKNANHTDWTTGKILEQDRRREGIFTHGLDTNTDVRLCMRWLPLNFVTQDYTSGCLTRISLH